MPDTAVQEAPVTAAATETPPEPAPLETDEVEAPVTEGAPEAPVTDGEEEARTYTAAEIEAARKEATERTNASWNKWREETQTKAQREAQAKAYAENAQRAEQTRRGFAFNALQGIAKVAVAQAFNSGKDTPELDARALAQVAQELNAAQFHDAHTELVESLWDTLQAEFPGYQPSVALAQYAQAMSAAYDRKGMVAAQTHMIREAVEQATEAKTRARIEAEAAAAAARKPVPAKPRTAGPTNVAGTSGGNSRPTTQSEAYVTFAASREAGDGKFSLQDLKRALATLPG